MTRLALSQAIDVLNVVTDSEDCLPAGDRVSADNGMLGRELAANVERVAALFFVELEFVVFGGLGEEGLGVGCCEGVEELLVGG